MAWALWVMCPRSWGKLWLNYYVFLPVALTCRADGVRACTPRRPRDRHSGLLWPTRTGHRYIRYVTPGRRLSRISALLERTGCAKSGGSAERQSRRAARPTQPQRIQGAGATPFPHIRAARTRRAAPEGWTPALGAALISSHGQRRVLRREKTVQSRSQR